MTKISLKFYKGKNVGRDNKKVGMKYRKMEVQCLIEGGRQAQLLCLARLLGAQPWGERGESGESGDSASWGEQVCGDEQQRQTKTCDLKKVE